MKRETSADSETTDARRTTDSNDRGLVHQAILEIYFFGWIDRGIGADESPLFTLWHGDEDAQTVIEAARREVAL
jgi:hypothetical protein